MTQISQLLSASFFTTISLRAKRGQTYWAVKLPFCTFKSTLVLKISASCCLGGGVATLIALHSLPLGTQTSPARTLSMKSRVHMAYLQLGKTQPLRIMAQYIVSLSLTRRATCSLDTILFLRFFLSLNLLIIRRRFLSIALPIKDTIIPSKSAFTKFFISYIQA